MPAPVARRQAAYHPIPLPDEAQAGEHVSHPRNMPGLGIPRLSAPTAKASVTYHSHSCRTLPVSAGFTRVAVAKVGMACSPEASYSPLGEAPGFLNMCRKLRRWAQLCARRRASTGMVCPASQVTRMVSYPGPTGAGRSLM